MAGRILTLQRQARELGRLRTGYTDHSGPKAFPVKSATWVMTSHAEHYVQGAAEQWGGTVEKWQPLGNGAPQFRVITEAKQIDALLPPGDPLSQYNELWSGGGCQRRCDGQVEQLTKQQCLCVKQFGEDWHQQPKGRVCSATSRLNVILPDMPDMGVWRAETHSFYAANEWGGTVDMVLSGTGGKGLVPVTLRIEPRQRVANGKTKKFPVVVVEIRGVTPRQALTGPLSMAVALDPSTAPRIAIEAARPDYRALAAGALTRDDVQDVYRQAHAAGHLDDQLVADLKALADAVAEPASTPPQLVPDEDGAVDAEVVEEDLPAEYPPAPWPTTAKPRG